MAHLTLFFFYYSPLKSVTNTSQRQLKSERCAQSSCEKLVESLWSTLYFLIFNKKMKCLEILLCKSIDHFSYLIACIAIYPSQVRPSSLSISRSASSVYTGKRNKLVTSHFCKETKMFCCICSQQNHN